MSRSMARGWRQRASVGAGTATSCHAGATIITISAMLFIHSRWWGAGTPRGARPDIDRL
jgi:hypothetical protein